MMGFKNILGFRTKYSLRLALKRYNNYPNFDFNGIQKDKPICYLFLAADYGNLGDVAITFAQEKFLRENANLQVVEIPISKSMDGLWYVKRNIKKEDIITIVGGGNMGDLYDQIEFIRQLVIKFFPNNKIVSFPQTIDFSDTKEGLRLLRVAQNVYNKHKELHIVAREQVSFQKMKEVFPKSNVYLCPDIVLSLNLANGSSANRSGVVFCMRADAEKAMSQTEENLLRTIVSERFESAMDYDTHIGRSGLSRQERELELEKIWKCFREAELVVTDRLHGMIFCYITNTPCIVFQNNNHKIRETYEWIAGKSNITLFTDVSEARIREYLDGKLYQNNVPHQSMGEAYQVLLDILKAE